MLQEPNNSIMFRIDYQPYGVATRDFLQVLPEREPDYIEVLDPSRDHNGEHMTTVKYWFEEARMVHTDIRYHNPLDLSSLKREASPGACSICPISGHLMYISENDGQWVFANKAAQDFYVNWLCDQHFVGEGEDESIQ